MTGLEIIKKGRWPKPKQNEKDQRIPHINLITKL